MVAFHLIGVYAVVSRVNCRSHCAVFKIDQPYDLTSSAALQLISRLVLMFCKLFIFTAFVECVISV